MSSEKVERQDIARVSPSWRHRSLGRVPPRVEVSSGATQGAFALSHSLVPPHASIGYRIFMRSKSDLRIKLRVFLVFQPRQHQADQPAKQLAFRLGRVAGGGKNPLELGDGAGQLLGGEEVELRRIADLDELALALGRVGAVVQDE